MKINKSDLTVIQDMSEQHPLVFPAANVEIGMLLVGKYSQKGFEDQIAIERKSLQNLLSSLGEYRERFAREIRQLRKYKYRALIVESPLSALNNANWHSKITPQSVVRSLLRINAAGLRVTWSENRTMSARIIELLLYQFQERREG